MRKLLTSKYRIGLATLVDGKLAKVNDIQDNPWYPNSNGRMHAGEEPKNEE